MITNSWKGKELYNVENIVIIYTIWLHSKKYLRGHNKNNN